MRAWKSQAYDFQHVQKDTDAALTPTVGGAARLLASIEAHLVVDRGDDPQQNVFWSVGPVGGPHKVAIDEEVERSKGLVVELVLERLLHACTHKRFAQGLGQENRLASVARPRWTPSPPALGRARRTPVIRDLCLPFFGGRCLGEALVRCAPAGGAAVGTP